MAENGNNSFLAKSVKVELTTDLSKYEQGLKKAEKDLEKFTKAVETNKKKQEELQKKIDESTKAKGADAKETKTLIDQLAKLKTQEDQLKKNIDDTNASIKRQATEMVNSSGTMQKGLGGVKTAALAVKAALLSMTAVKLKEWLIDSNAEWEIYEANLSTILQSTSKANNLLNSLTDFATKTPFEISGLVEASEQLLAFGVGVDDLEMRLTQLGNLSRGQQDIFERITTAYGKMQAKGKVSLEELNMLTESGVPILNELANVLNTDNANLFTLISNGAVSVNEVNQAFSNMTSEGGQFYGLMEKQSKTLNGMLSNLGDFASNLGRSLGEEAFAEVKDALGDLLDELDRMEKTGELQEIIEDLGGGIASITKTLLELIKLLYEYKDVIATAAIAWGTYTVALKAANVAKETYKTITIATTVATTEEAAAKKAATIAQLKLNAAIAAAVVAITLVVKWVHDANQAWDEYQKSADEVIGTTQGVVKSWETEIKAIEKNKIKMDEYMRQIDALGGSEEEFKRNKEEIAKLVEKVNDLYPELELGINSEGTALNKTNKELADYIKLKEEQARATAAQNALQGLYDSQYDMYAEAKLTVARLKEIKKQMAEIDLRPGTIGHAVFSEQGREYAALEKEYLALKESLLELEDESGIVAGVIKELETELSSYGDVLEGTTDNTEDITDATGEYAKALAETDEAIKKIQGDIDDLAGTTDYFNEIIADNKTELGLSKSQILDLINKYPEITDKIYETADGYKVEQGALEDLKTVKEDHMRKAIEAEIAMADQQNLSTMNRLTAIQQEIEGIGSLAEAKAKLAQLEAETSNYYTDEGARGKSPSGFNTNGRSPSGFNANGKSERETTTITGDSGGKTKVDWEGLAANQADQEKVKEVIGIYEDLEKSAAEYSARIEALNKSLSISTSGLGSDQTGGKTGTPTGETEIEKELRNLKYDYNIGKIAAEDYYKQLSDYANNYFAVNSKEWQTYTLEVANGWKRLNQELYNSSKDDIQGKIDDGEFYGTISYSDYEDYYSQLKDIAKNAYNKGIIDEKEYANEIKQINKDLYSAKKKYIEDYYDAQKEAVSKAYETARNEINQYYDDIERREKQAEYGAELADIDEQISKYSNAKTGAGMEQLENLKKQREELIKEMARSDREVEKQSSLEALEEKYNNWQTAQETVFNNVSTYAEDTSNILIELSRRVNQTIQEMNALANTGYQTINNTKNVNVNLTNNNNLQTQADFEVLMRQNSSSIAYGLKF